MWRNCGDMVQVWSHLQIAERGVARKMWRVRDTTRSYDARIDVWSTPASTFERAQGLIEFSPSQSVRHGMYQMDLIALPPYQGSLSERLHDGGFSAAYSRGEQRTVLTSEGMGQPFVAVPSLPDWSRVERRACAITDARRTMLFAHPRDSEVLELTWGDVSAQEMIIFVGGIEDEVCVDALVF